MTSVQRSRLREAWQRVVWWLYRRLFTVGVVDGIAFVDIRFAKNEAGRVLALLKESVGYLETAGVEYRKLVGEQITFIAATYHKREHIPIALRAYVGPFTSLEGRNSFYLASRLVWIANYIRAHREAWARGEQPDDAQVRKDSSDLTARFLRQFPHSEEWIGYLALAGGQNAAHGAPSPRKPTYRRGRHQVTWHFCSDCSTWPTSDYDDSTMIPPTSELCNECIARRASGRCRERHEAA